MDDDFDARTGSAGSHILASVSKVRVEAKARTLPIVVARGKKPLWGFTYTSNPKPGEDKFAIVDEVRFSLLCLIIFGSVCVFGFLLADMGQNHVQVRDILSSWAHGLAVLIGGIFSMLACVLSFIQIRSHKRNWTHPPSQKHVVRILYMVPIYAISAWGSLTFLNLSAYIDFVRGVYEAYVIWTFMLLLTKYLGGHNGVVEWMKYKPPQAWPSPMCCLKPVVPDSRFLYYLKYGALQYTILTPICSLAAVILTYFGAFEDGVIEATNGYPYIAFVLNASQLVSLYCLVWLYVCMKNELMPFGPLAKFMVVKAVVFATFWQGIGLAFAARFGWLEATDEFSVGEVQVGMQDFLVCIEMFIAACTHKYTFGSETYADGTLRLIMEQRSMYLAEQSYKRGVEAQQAALVAAGLPAEEIKEETEEDRIARQEAMAELIRRNMDEDAEDDVLFDEDLIDWTSGALPAQTDASGAVVLTDAQRMHAADGMMGKSKFKVHSAYDYVYAYELEHQRPEGVDLPPEQQHARGSGVQMGRTNKQPLSPSSAARVARHGGRASDYLAAGAGHHHSLADEEVDFGYAADPVELAIVAAAPEVLTEDDIVDEEDPQRHVHRAPQPQRQVQRQPQRQQQQQARPQQQQQQRLPPPQARSNNARAVAQLEHDDVFGDAAVASALQPKKKTTKPASGTRLPPPQSQQPQQPQPRGAPNPSAARSPAPPRSVSASPSDARATPGRSPPSARAPHGQQQQRQPQAQQQRRPPPPPQSHTIDLDENPFE